MQSRSSSRKFRPGFTIIELLVVIGISAVLSGMAIVYSHVGQNAVAVSVEEGKLSQFILEAKQLAAATYGAAGVCGYGVLVDYAATPQTYSLFAFKPPLDALGHCPPANGATGISSIGTQPAWEARYSEGTWNVPVSQGVKLMTGLGYPSALSAVVFYPPDPTVFLSTDNATFPSPAATLSIYLQSANGQTQATITVNPEGQVSFF